MLKLLNESGCGIITEINFSTGLENSAQDGN